MVRCEECGSILEYDSRREEYVCSRCGLVHEFVDQPASARSVAVTIVKTEPRIENGVMSSIEKIADGMPTFVKLRAKAIAKKALKLLGPKVRYEAFAFACVKAAAGEYGIVMDTSVLPRSTRRVASRYFSVMKKMNLFTVENPREKVLRELKFLCIELGLDYQKCCAVFNRYESLLSGKKAQTSALIVCMVVAIKENDRDKQKRILDLCTHYRRRATVREIAVEIAKREKINLNTPVNCPFSRKN